MKMIASVAAAVWLLCPVGASLSQAAESLGNIEDFIREQESIGVYRPGTCIISPDGSRARIIEKTPEGFKTDTGLVISPEGIILEGEGKGLAVKPETAEDIDEKQEAAPDMAVMLPGAVNPEEESKPEIKQMPVPQAPEEKRQPEQHEQAKQPEGPLTLAQMLPVTRTPEKAGPAAKAPKEPAAPEKPAPQVKQEKKTPVEQKKAEKKQPEQKKPEKKTPARPRAGEELRIPPEAAKTGNLAFLEGCWQGTRPEYFSKRTIRECFCFNAGGKTGKRRVYDPSFNRMCIGSSHATLSNGVLSVSSSGAACTDGERWGQAEMVCRNSGPKTPCSWVFRDARNGRQSYQIPFVRVESCGR